MDSQAEHNTSQLPENNEILVEDILSPTVMQKMRELTLKNPTLNVSSLVLLVGVIFLIKWLSMESEIN